MRRVEPVAEAVQLGVVRPVADADPDTRAVKFDLSFQESWAKQSEFHMRNSGVQARVPWKICAGRPTSMSPIWLPVPPGVQGANSRLPFSLLLQFCCFCRRDRRSRRTSGRARRHLRELVREHQLVVVGVHVIEVRPDVAELAAAPVG